MSRVIKYRVWDTHFNRYHSTDVELLGSDLGLRETNPQDTLSKYRTQIEFFGPGVERDQRDRERFVLEQFTGLVDSKGQDIYEGDIVEIRVYDGWKDLDGFTVRYEVKWSTVSVGWRGFRPAMDETSAGVVISDNPTILGNIHEHPNLLTT